MSSAMLLTSFEGRGLPTTHTFDAASFTTLFKLGLAHPRHLENFCYCRGDYRIIGNDSQSSLSGFLLLFPAPKKALTKPRPGEVTGVAADTGRRSFPCKTRTDELTCEVVVLKT